MIFLEKNNLEKLQTLENQPTFLIPILSDHKKHWKQNRLSFIYIIGLETWDEFIVGCNHNDVCEIYPHILALNWLSCKERYIYNKKYLIENWGGYEANMVYWISTNESLLKFKFNSIYYDWYPDHENVNDIIPIMKWIQYCREIKDRFILEQKKFEKKIVLDLYCSEIFCNLVKIEENGIHTAEGKLYTEYNPYTITGRPANSFGGTNFAAIPKESELRKRMVSRFDNGVLIEIDFRAYHFHLISKILGYDWEGKDIYEEFAKFYFKTENPSQNNLEFIKSEMFRQIYGRMDDEMKEHPFLQKVQELIKNLWTEYQLGNLKSLLFEKPIQNLKDMNPAKVFNYLIQNLETEFNGTLLTKLHRFLENKQTKIILYTYDSLLFDYSREDGKDFLKEIREILNEIPFRVKIGRNYSQMKEI